MLDTSEATARASKDLFRIADKCRSTRSLQSKTYSNGCGLYRFPVFCREKPAFEKLGKLAQLANETRCAVTGIYACEDFRTAIFFEKKVHTIAFFGAKNKKVVENDMWLAEPHQKPVFGSSHRMRMDDRDLVPILGSPRHGAAMRNE